MREFLSQSCRLVRRAVGLAALAAATASAAAAQPVAAPTLGGAESFALLAGVSVSGAGAPTVSGDVGANAGGMVTGVTPAAGGTVHAGDAVAVQAHHDALAAYQDLVGRTCSTGPVPAAAITGPIAAGVHCYTGDATLGNVTLTGNGPWIFKISGTLTAAFSSSVAVAGSAACKGTDVFWQIGDDNPATALGTSSIGSAAFVGNVLSRGNVSLTSATVDGRVFAFADVPGATPGGGVVTISGGAVNACSYGSPLPTAAPFKVTGGGGINVPSPNSTDPDATGNGFSNYGFNAQPALNGTPATGNFNYVNHVIAPHIHANGPVTDVDVVGLNDDGTAQTVRFSGTCNQLLPDCTFSVMVQDNGEPGRNDQFGVTIVSNGTVVEARTMRQVRNGNIQFHDSSLTTTVNGPTLRPGQTLRLSARLQRRHGATPADAYVVLRLPDGQMMSWTGGALVPGLVPLARNFVPVDFVGEILQLRVPNGVPPGDYVWLSALTEPGTLNPLSSVSQQGFTITP